MSYLSYPFDNEISLQAIETPEYQHFVIGCDRSPLPGQEYCTHHVEMNHSSQINLIEDEDEDYTLLRN
ncbi:unnamed protein product, partial [Rotaria magnacalcarata]